ncbi:hypothetical protein PI124_g6231 [Phytophthora idaei]|nr:hypothetical protein PI126_g7335 [Phytophthora idaei]KAG3249124.1 hypothetical protein PI124_g6231 [Phytophthora idaei]
MITVPRIHMDLAVKFEDFDSSEQFTVLETDKYDLTLGMPWLEKHEPWIEAKPLVQAALQYPIDH